MTERDEAFLKTRLNPLPVSIRFTGKTGQEYFRLDGAAKIRILTTEKLDLPQIRNTVKLFWGCEPKITRGASAKAALLAPEAYRVSVTESQITISAANRLGVLHALKTLRQLAEEERGVLKFTAYELPPCEIEDQPSLPFRALHLCIFPENHLWQLERAVKLAAYYKYNYIVIETWGVYPFRKHPELCWNGKGLDRDELKRIISDAQALGVTMIPQFNLLGHASGSRENGGKHVVINQTPELASLFEPDGWSWCISSPVVRQVLTDCVEDMLELFGNPPFFHIGCDEARLLGSCRTCRKQPLKKLVKSHLLYFHKLLKKHNARTIMWHDMLLCREDKRWDNYIVCGKEADGLGDLLQELPKDIIIADWQYGYPEQDGKAPTWATSKFFHDSGFDTLVCPCGNLPGLRSLAELARKTPLFGLLETTWSDLDKCMLTTLYKCSAAAWHGGDTAKLSDEFLNEWAPDSMCQMHHHLRQVENDMGCRDYYAAGRIILQTPEKIFL